MSETVTTNSEYERMHNIPELLKDNLRKACEDYCRFAQATAFVMYVNGLPIIYGEKEQVQEFAEGLK